MKISIEWLKEFLDLPESVEQLRADLTMAGLVVESVTEMYGAPVFELEVTSNRPDCLSYIGVAREIAARYGRRIRQPRAATDLRAAEGEVSYSIEIRDPDLCPRYVGLVLDSIRVGPSPDWMQRRLEASGMRPVNNIVDITNYVMLERGQPLHAFDFDRLREGRIVVARSGAVRKMVTLDGIERTLEDDMLLIQDGGGPVAIAGVMGGAESEIDSGTRRVLLECAYFQPASVRRTSKRLGLSTEASYRFERGADWDAPPAAIARTCALIRRHAGGRVSGSMQDAYPARIEPARIELRRKRIESLLGIRVTPQFVISTLKRLQFKPVRQARGAWLVECPSYRADVELEADLVEEIARFYGYQNIPATIPPARHAGENSPVRPCEEAVRRILSGLGYSENIHLSFAGEEEHRRFPATAGQPLAVRNPLTEETQYMRSWLAPGLIRTALHDFHHDCNQVRVFELAKVFGAGENGAIAERRALGMLGSGGDRGTNWRYPAADYDFYHLKGAVQALLRGLRCTSFEFLPARGPAWLSPDCVAEIRVADQPVGWLGRLHPSLEEELKIKQPVYVAEIDFQGLQKFLFSPVHYETIPRFPSVERDVSFVVDREVPYGQIRQGVTELGISELTGCDLIDVYEGNQIPSGKVSMTVRLTFLAGEGTLTVDRVQSFSDNIRTFLHTHFGAELR